MSSRLHILAAERSHPVQAQVFADPSRRRKTWMRRLAMIGLAVMSAWSFLFLGDIASLGHMQSTAKLLRAVSSVTTEPGQDSAQFGMPLLSETAQPAEAIGASSASQWTCPALPDAANRDAAPRVFAFLPTAEDWAHLSLKRECGAIDTLMPETFVIDAGTLALSRVKTDAEAQDAVRRFLENAPPGTEVFPTIRLGQKVNTKAFFLRLETPNFRRALIDEIGRAAANEGATGMCLDLGGWTEDGSAAVSALVKGLRSTLSASGLKTCVISSVGQGFWKTRATADSADYVVLRMFDEPWIGSPPAPLAAEGWFDIAARDAVTRIGADKLVFAIGTFSVDWVSGRPVPETIGFSEAMARISSASGHIEFARGSSNSFSSFVDANGQRHEIWLLDAVSAHNQMVSLRGLGARNIAISDLGFEDPGLWAVLAGSADSPEDLAHAMRSVPMDDYVSYSGDGPFLKIGAAPVAGLRKLQFDGTAGRITGETYSRVPEPASIQRYGRAAANQIVLTFDDGPHPDYTRDILDALRDTGTPAAFFLVGNNALRAPDLVRRMIDEGHEIGSHTFMHPRMDQISYYRSVAEINSVQKLIAGMTGRAVRLYREPFLSSSGPITARQSEPLRLLESAGYVIAGSDIVPLDWKDTPADQIVSYVMEQVGAGAGNVIVLHDAGNDRSQTVKAVPALIRALRDSGYEFVSMAQVLGTSRDALMPQVAGSQVVLDNVSFSAVAMFWDFLVVLFWVAIVVGAVRSLAVLILALLRRRRKFGPGDALPSVTVVIPAYNEEVVIVKSVGSVLASDYPGLKVIVVDDGSTDRTLQRVLQVFGGDSRVQVLTQPNQGKWRALNAAYRVIDTEIAVCLDADTQIDAGAIRALARHFSDPRVGAVAGKLVVGNRRNLLTRLQALEYITAQAIDRRAADLINGMLVVPGAVGAWRVAAVREVGLYSGATLSEDADLTVSLIRAGYRAAFDETAIAYTEAPARIRSFLAQRLRWSLGMFQTGWKHRRALREGRAVGMVALPDLAIFGYVFPLLAPLADALFLYLVYDYFGTALSGDPRVTTDPPAYLFLGYLALPLMDVLTSFLALCIDRKEPFRLLLLFPLQRLLYRQLLYVTVLRALLSALTGRLTKWNKQDRAGFVTVQRVR